MNEDTVYQHLRDAFKAVLREKYIVENAYSSKAGGSQISSLNFQHKKLEEEDQNKTKATQKKKTPVEVIQNPGN